MIIKCDKCGKEFNRSPVKIKDVNFCSRQCFSDAYSPTTPCHNCGKLVKRHRSQTLKQVFCTRECAKIFTSRRMTALNQELNPDRMVQETREKLRNFRLGTGEGKSYEKTYGRHTHRIAAEAMIGRKLRKGEVVHHIDENKRNNHPLNLMVFPSQAAHARWHQNEKNNPDRNYE